MSVLSKNVIDNALHVPRVRTASHVESVSSKSVHRWDSIPLNTNDETNKEGDNGQKTGPMGVPELTCTAWAVFFTVGPSTVFSWLPISEIATPTKNVMASQISGAQDSSKVSLVQNPASNQEPTWKRIQREVSVMARVNQRSATIPETMIATIPVRRAE